MKTDDKKIYLVDSGLSFNLPFPLTLRPLGTAPSQEVGAPTPHPLSSSPQPSEGPPQRSTREGVLRLQGRGRRPSANHRVLPARQLGSSGRTRYGFLI